MLLTQAMPLCIWIAAVGTALYLWSEVGSKAPILGFAHGVEHKVAPTADGRVANLAVDIGYDVSPGQIVATLDPRDVDAKIRIQQAQLGRLEAELRAVEARSQQQTLSTARGFEQAGDSAKVALAKAQGDLQVKAAELDALTARRKELSNLLSRGLVINRELAALDLRHAGLTREVKATRKLVALLAAQLDSTRTRQKALPGNSTVLAVAPLQEEKKVVLGRLTRLRAQRKALVLRAPSSGRISAILKRHGEVVRAGEAVVTVVSKATSRVVACVYEKQAMAMRVGRKVTLYARGWSNKTYRGHVVGVGPIVDKVPARCRPEPRQLAWGRDMFIELDEPGELVPGLAFNVSLEKEVTFINTATAAPAETPPGQPSLMTVPSKLMVASRFEPSGLIWAPRLGRYVMVSDDTGHKGMNDHAPWLFTMSKSGAVDDKPLVVQGARKFNDLESVASGVDDALYLLASQSHSKKGNRKASRQIFARLQPAGRGYRLDASVALAQLLDQADESTLASLGLSDTSELDIEGMTSFDRGLLIGLKAPLSKDGRAIIWRMKEPDRLLASGKLADAGLSLWAEVALRVKADGREVAGGIAELLSLPDGTVVVASTASGINPSSQDGSLWHVRRSSAGSVGAQRFVVFAGRKPEGLALSPNPGQLTVGFDAGQATPAWVEIPWPR